MNDKLFVDTSDVDQSLEMVSRIIEISTEEIAQRRDFADALEVWLAALLAVHPKWTLSGRWFDGLLIDACSKGSSSISLRGRVFLLSSQREICFSTTISTLAGHTSNFELEVSASDHSRVLAARRGPSRHPFPVHRWGRVEGSDAVSALRIDEAVGGFLFITQEPHGVFDVWLETEADVSEALSKMSVVWDPAALELT